MSEFLGLADLSPGATEPPGAVLGEILAGPETGWLEGECAEPDEWSAGRVLVVRELRSSMYPLLRSSRAVVCAFGGPAGHMSAVCRAKGITVIRIPEADLVRMRGTVRIDRSRGLIDLGSARGSAPGVPADDVSRSAPPGSTCAVVAGGEEIDAVNESGWGSTVDRFFVREEFLCLEAGLSPLDLLAAGPDGQDRYAREMAAMILGMRSKLQPHQKIVYRLLDLRSDDAAGITRTAAVGEEANPELGLHGTRWIVETPAYVDVVRSVVRRLAEQEPGIHDSLALAGPFVADCHEFSQLAAALGLPERWTVSAFVETPAGVYDVPAICRAGAAEVFIGTKDLVQLFLAADRGNHRVAGSYNTRHPAVIDALARAIMACQSLEVPVRVYSFARDLDHYLSRLPRPTGYIMDSAELIARLGSHPGRRAERCLR